MNKHLISTITFCFMLFLVQCQNNVGQNQLSVKDFQAKLQQTPNAQLVDVRTPKEYADGHLENALYVDWNAKDFVEKVSFLDKQKPVFVYCLVGGRSASACSKLKTLGFTEIYEMQGGIAKWKGEKLPLASNSKKSDEGMSIADFEKIIAQKNVVLIDFTAQWCAPCKKLKPILEKIAKDNPDIAVIPVDFDANPTVATTYKVDALPVLMIFEKGKKIWENIGFLDEKAILKALKK